MHNFIKLTSWQNGKPLYIRRDYAKYLYWDDENRCSVVSPGINAGLGVKDRIEYIIAEVEARCPGARFIKLTGAGDNVTQFIRADAITHLGWGHGKTLIAFDASEGGLLVKETHEEVLSFISEALAIPGTVEVHR